eukprot:1560437-Amphidinium_carterae.1
MPMSKIHRIKPISKPSKVLPASIDLAKSPSLAVLRGRGASLAPRHKTSRSAPPGQPRVPLNPLGKLS